MTARILEIQKRSNQYMQNFNGNAVKIIESEDISGKILDLNRSQFISHVDAEDKPLVHKSTKSQNLTRAYARKTGKSKPDFFVSGDFFDKMKLTMPSVKEYFILSRAYVSQFLSIHYGKIFGVSPKNQAKAQTMTDKAIIEDYKKNVFI